MTLLRTSAKCHPKRCAIVAEGTRISYAELYSRAKAFAGFIAHEYHIEKGSHVAMMCRNHEWSVMMLAALSRLGANIMLINTDVSSCKVSGIIAKGKVMVLFYDEEYAEKVIDNNHNVTHAKIEDAANAFIKQSTYTATHPTAGKATYSLPHPITITKGRITVFTGGTSGIIKGASRSNGIMQFLPPLTALMKDIHIYRYRSVLLALPVYHGFGLATLVISLLLGKKICLMRHFDADNAVALVSNEQLEVLPIVPAMLSGMLTADTTAELAKSVKCIICGGDRLERGLADKVQRQLGDVLFNLYGTTEAGFFLMAKPSDIASNAEVPIGRPIAGVKCRMKDADAEGIGTLWVKSRWAMIGRKNQWQSTGDRVVKNANGYFFHRGRVDNMVVCGGENVYPENVQSILTEHPEVADALVYPVPDVFFGRVLNAQVQLVPSSVLTSDDIRRWLKPRVSRAEMPHNIIISDISLLSTGKKRVPPLRDGCSGASILRP